MMVQEFARMILKSMAVYEDHWSKKGQRYDLSHHEAAVKACLQGCYSDRWAGPIGFLLATAWNDSRMWAEEIGKTGRKPGSKGVAVNASALTRKA